MEIERTLHQGVAILKPAGRKVLGGDDVPTFVAALHSCAQQHRLIVVDASSLEFIGSDALDALLDLRDRLRLQRGSLAVTGLNKALRDALVLAGIDVRLDLYAGLDDAIRGTLRQASGIERWH